MSRDHQPEQPRDDGHTYVDRSKIDFDPAEGLYTGTAVRGTSEIPGPHEREQAEHDQAEREQAEEG